jgi:hypothetical protein
VCGYLNHGVESVAVRVRARDLVTTGVSLGAVPYRCAECRFPMPDVTANRYLTPEDRERIENARRKRRRAA